LAHQETALPSFGEKLKLEREKRKISLDQISSTTKIGTRMLQALEEDKFNQLPGGIFNKGFVRAYARAVGLDEEQTVADYLQASGDAPAIRPELVHNLHASSDEDDDAAEICEPRDDNARPLPWGWLAAALLVIALALTLWSHHRREQEKQLSPSSSSMVAPSAPMAVNPLPSSGTEKSSSPNPGAFSRNPGAHSSPASATIPASASPNPPGATPAIGEFTVTITAREESWISITTDGKSAGSELLEADNERTLHAYRQIVVKAGNAGGIDFKFNGKKITTAGDYGEVRTLTFGPTGLISNKASDSTQ
jgi:cytoskeletal protein RodZ